MTSDLNRAYNSIKNNLAEAAGRAMPEDGYSSATAE